MKSKTRFIVIGLIAASILVLGVPLIINALYQSKTKYLITAWNAADVLGFYGNVLGAGITAASLGLTIWFTKRQIGRDTYLKQTLERWKSIESVISNALNIISPLRFMPNVKDGANFQTVLSNNIIFLKEYRTVSLNEINNVKTYISAQEYKKLETLIDQIDKDFNSFSHSADELAKEYRKMMLDEENTSGRVSESLDLLYKQTSDLYFESYLHLLQMKRDTFEKIYTDIEKEADQMLEFGRRRKHANS